MSVLIEICACSVDDVLAAEQGGADRVELCSARPLGGLTPTIGSLIEAKSKSNLPIFAMVRPRGGGFAYSENELATMERDIDLLMEFGASGLVFGLLREDGQIHTEQMNRMIKRSKGLPVVFHRAFDVIPDPLLGLEQLIDLGICRVLTSGQRPTALGGVDLISRLVDQSKGSIEVMPGGGVRPSNLVELVSRTGCRSVHLGATKRITDASTRANPAIAFGLLPAGEEEWMDVVDQVVVAAIVAEAGNL